MTLPTPCRWCPLLATLIEERRNSMKFAECTTCLYHNEYMRCLDCNWDDDNDEPDNYVMRCIVGGRADDEADTAANGTQ